MEHKTKQLSDKNFLKHQKKIAQHSWIFTHTTTQISNFNFKKDSDFDWLAYQKMIEKGRNCGGMSPAFQKSISPFFLLYFSFKDQLQSSPPK